MGTGLVNTLPQGNCMPWLQVCFKCGQKGHWAADCKSELPTGQKENVNMAWCVTDTAVLDTDAGPLPTFLRADAVATLAAHGAVSGAYIAQGALACTDNPVEAPSVHTTLRQGGGQRDAQEPAYRDTPAFNACLADLDSAYLEECSEAATQVGSEGPTVVAPSSGQAVHDAQGIATECLGALNSQVAMVSDVEGVAHRAACEQPCPSRPVGEGQNHTSVDETLQSVLRDAFGFEDFRSFQLPVIRKLLQVRTRELDVAA